MDVYGIFLENKDIIYCHFKQSFWTYLERVLCTIPLPSSPAQNDMQYTAVEAHNTAREAGLFL